MMVVCIVILITQTTTEGNLLGIILDNIPDEGNLLGIIPDIIPNEGILPEEENLHKATMRGKEVVRRIDSVYQDQQDNQDIESVNSLYSCGIHIVYALNLGY